MGFVTPAQSKYTGLVGHMGNRWLGEVAVVNEANGRACGLPPWLWPQDEGGGCRCGQGRGDKGGASVVDVVMGRWGRVAAVDEAAGTVEGRCGD